MYTHAIFAKFPEKVKPEEKKIKLDQELLRAQCDGFQETLRQAGIAIMELPEESNQCCSLFVNDLAVVIGQTALICRTTKLKEVPDSLRRMLKQLVWRVLECPQKTDKGTKVYLEASDVLYTGKEIFVATRKNGTNVEGAMILARAFPSLPVVIVPLGNSPPLRFFLSMALPEKVIAVGNSKEAQNVLKLVEREATFRYKTITTAEDTASACLNVNGRVVVRQDRPEAKYSSLKDEGLELWALDVSELSKLGHPFTRFCLLVTFEPKSD
ncbi:unnamed protein product, partial [Mesorhabditis belari]|uniref:Dimethylargininase n=1 Tax=Mesorhabditis belari TaxID=2138241 RepID=A0AAF3FLZ2_9BILA